MMNHLSIHLLTLSNAIALVGAAYFQHVLHHEPCPWCVLIRIILVFLLLTTTCYWRASTSRIRFRLVAAIQGLMGFGGFLAASYMHLVASHSDACFKTMADKLISFSRLDELAPWFFEVKGLCSDASVTVLGIPMEGYAAMIFIGYMLNGAAAYFCRDTRSS